MLRLCAYIQRYRPVLFNNKFRNNVLQAPLGVFVKDENKLDEIVDVLQELQKYVPSKSEMKDVHVPGTNEVRPLREIVFHRVLFGGNQLTLNMPGEE